MWYKASSSSLVKPEIVDITSSQEVVFIRKDFVLIPESSHESQVNPAHWEYLERTIAKEDYDLFVELEKTKANLDYVAMMTDVDIPAEA